METADLVVINTCAIREGGRAEGHRSAGPPRPAQGGEPGDAGRADRLLGPRAGSGGSDAALPSRGPVPAAGRGARARRSTRSGIGAGRDRSMARSERSVRPRRSVGRSSASPMAWRRPAPAAIGEGTVARELGDQRLAADHLRLRQDLHLLHRAVQPRTRAQPAVRRDPRRGAAPGRTGLPRGHAARPERQLLRPRPAARGPLRATSTPNAGPAGSSTCTAGPTSPS